MTNSGHVLQHYLPPNLITITTDNLYLYSNMLIHWKNRKQ